MRTSAAHAGASWVAEAVNTCDAGKRKHVCVSAELMPRRKRSSSQEGSPAPNGDFKRRKPAAPRPGCAPPRLPTTTPIGNHPTLTCLTPNHAMKRYVRVQLELSFNSF